MPDVNQSNRHRDELVDLEVTFKDRDEVDLVATFKDPKISKCEKNSGDENYDGKSQEVGATSYIDSPTKSYDQQQIHVTRTSRSAKSGRSDPRCRELLWSTCNTSKFLDTGVTHQSLRSRPDMIFDATSCGGTPPGRTPSGRTPRVPTSLFDFQRDCVTGARDGSLGHRTTEELTSQHHNQDDAVPKVLLREGMSRGYVERPTSSSVTDVRTQQEPAAEQIKQDEAKNAKTQERYSAVRRLELILSERSTVARAADEVFAKYAGGKSGALSSAHIRSIIERLDQALSLRSKTTDATIKQLILPYTAGTDDRIEYQSFRRLYESILLAARDRLNAQVVKIVGREFFVTHHWLTGKPGDSISSKFDTVRVLGAGAFGEVSLVVDRVSKLYRCLKSIDKNHVNVNRRQVIAEIDVMKKLDHQNIARIYEAFEDLKHLYLVVEYVDGFDVYEFIKKFRKEEIGGRTKLLKEKYIQEIFEQIMRGVGYCHSKNIVHRDLKPQNVMLTSSCEVRIIDFGISEILDEAGDKKLDCGGTGLYMAPEVFRGDASFKSDIFSLGCILYNFFTGNYPFYHENFETLKSLICGPALPDFKNGFENVSDEAVDLLKKMLDKEVAGRPTADQVLRHPWMRSNEEQRLAIKKRHVQQLRILAWRQNALYSALKSFVVHQLGTTSDEYRQLNLIFRSIDSDVDGELSPSEVKEHLADNTDLGPEEISAIARAMDVRCQDKISHSEFVAACYEIRETDIRVLWSSFRKIDKDDDNRLDAEELGALTSGFVHRDQIQELMRDLDKNGDQRVDWREFLSYMVSPVTTE